MTIENFTSAKNIQDTLEKVNTVLEMTADPTMANAQSVNDSILTIKNLLIKEDGTGISDDINTDLDNIWNRINDDIRLILSDRVTTLTNQFNEL